MSASEHPSMHLDDLPDGEMTQITIGETDVLLIRQGRAVHALHAYCTHYGAPLVQGALSGGRLVCPWHHACFDVASGDLLEPPGLDGLPRFDVRVDEEGAVRVEVPEPVPTRSTPPMARREEEDTRVFVVLGGGAAGSYAVEALREAGFAGRLCLITREDSLPYDRVSCSKEVLQGSRGVDELPLRSAAFYAERDVELLLGRTVIRVEAGDKAITFADGTTLSYDALLVCTGGQVRRLSVPGANLAGIHTLRSLRDSHTLYEAARAARRVVVVGASFIGMEGAWSMSQLGCAVTVVAPDALPFAGLWGDRVGVMLLKLHEAGGVQFRLGQQVARFEGERRVERVVLDGGEVLAADLVLVGIGVDPETAFLRGVARADDGGLLVDAYLRAADGLYAAGDVAHFPYGPSGARVRIEHWRLACQHGRLAGYNMAGRAEPFTSVPFFWSAQHGLGLYYVGHAREYDHILYDGDVEEHTFIAYYVKDGVVHAALGVNRNQEMAAIQELMRSGRMPDPEALEAGGVDLVARLQEGS